MNENMNRLLNDFLSKLNNDDKETLCILMEQAYKNGVEKTRQRTKQHYERRMSK